MLSDQLLDVTTWAPLIDAFPKPGTDDATGIFLLRRALEFILRHELAHVALNHEPRQVAEGLTTIECEREADLKAASWLRGSLQADSERSLEARLAGRELSLEQRAVSIGLGLGCVI